jgi:hypothetical protein
MARLTVNLTATIINGVAHIYRDGDYLGYVQGDRIVSPVTESEANAMLADALARRDDN